MSLGYFDIFCIDCDEPMQIRDEEFDKGQFHSCLNCGMQFNIFCVLNSFYESIPLARKIVDTYVSIVKSRYTVKGREEDLEKIDEFLNMNSFEKLLDQIIHDTTLFGTCIIEKKEPDPLVKLEKLDMTTAEVVTDWKQGAGARGFYEEIDRIILHQRQLNEIPSDNILVFTMDGIDKPLGFPILGFWFHHWYSLKFAPQAMINMKYLGRKWTLKTAKAFIKYAEDSVILGSGIPRFILEKGGIPEEYRGVWIPVLTSKINRHREKIANVVEEKIFPLALKRPYERKDYPEFVFL